jgi:zinc protease
VTAVHRSLSVAAAVVLATATAGAQALPKPEVAPERPFAPPPRVERTLSNGLRVVAVRYGSVPKLSAILTVKAGLAVDPPAKSGLAQIVAEAAQEGTTTRSSEQLKREVFALGATLSGAAGQDSTSLQMRGLSETLPRMLALLADVVRNPTFPQAELDLITANTAQQLQAQLASPQYVANKTFRQALFGEHPYARIGVTPESLPAIDRS